MQFPDIYFEKSPAGEAYRQQRHLEEQKAKKKNWKEQIAEQFPVVEKSSGS